MFTRSLSCVLLASMVASSALAAPRPKQPNVVLVVWDTTRADHLSPYGYERDTTPNLNEIAKSSVVFESATTSGWWTPPGVASLFSGVYQHNHGVDFQTEGYSLNLPEDTDTIAEHMQAAGYKTAAFHHKGQLRKHKGFDQGFELFEIRPEPQIVPAVLEWIDGQGEGPWFVMAYYNNPHAPYTPGAAHDRWTDEHTPEVDLSGCVDGLPEGTYKHCDISAGRVQVAAEEWDVFKANYDGELHQDDAQLGLLWAGLKKRELTDDLVFAFTSDHGESFNDRGQNDCWHKGPWRAVQHVPLILRLPQGKSATRIRSVVRTIDLLPTLVDIIGSELLGPVNGQSLLPVIHGKETQDRPNIGFSKARDTLYFVDEGHKVVFSRSDPSPRYLQLFNLETDHWEVEDLSEAQPELAEKMREKALAYMEATKLDIEGGSEVTDEQYDLLRELGYLEHVE